jgi:hypothetical protein
MVRVFVFLAVLAFVPSVTHAQGANGAAGAQALLSEARCEPVLLRQLAEWHADLPSALLDAPGPTGLRSVRVPTGTLGLWVRLVETLKGEVAIERLTATRTERLGFDVECVPVEYAVAARVPPAGAFTDSDLITQVARGGRGVVLLWSPHMPLSVDQHAVLATVAETLALDVIPVLDPAADADYAARVVRERGLSALAATPLGGIELVMRGMSTHVPSLQIYAGGKLVGPVLFGYRSEAALRAALEPHLAK